VAIAFVALGFAPAAAGGSSKVEVCHIPPGNPANFHTITVSSDALSAHLSHGDLAGPCSLGCRQLCDDGDACTIDDTGDCEVVGCPTGTRDPVNCDDGSACTVDSCDSVQGCIATTVQCTPSDACVTSACDPLTGDCVETPIVGCGGSTCSEDGACQAVLGETFVSSDTVGISGPCSECLGEDFTITGGVCSGPGCDFSGACNSASANSCTLTALNDACTAAVESLGCEAVCCP